MKFSLISLATFLAIVSGTPALFDRQNDSCGKQCDTDDDCSGSCHWCSQPAEWAWTCVDFDPNTPTTSIA
ncbi:hypothetical protein F4776DRAFT_472014 [Hypoxylon sp. NC0597]|nr:hypothetical protein F4776DRAFT_472014 [Hypoxylon sp. NC0597]